MIIKESMSFFNNSVGLFTHTGGEGSLNLGVGSSILAELGKMSTGTS